MDTLRQHKCVHCPNYFPLHLGHLPYKQFMNNSQEDLKEEVKNWMKSHGYSREWLAEQCGVQKSAVDEWFKKRRRIPETAERLIKQLMHSEVEADDFSKILPFLTEQDVTGLLIAAQEAQLGLQQFINRLVRTFGEKMNLTGVPTSSQPFSFENSTPTAAYGSKGDVIHLPGASQRVGDDEEKRRHDAEVRRRAKELLADNPFAKNRKDPYILEGKKDESQSGENVS